MRTCLLLWLLIGTCLTAQSQDVADSLARALRSLPPGQAYAETANRLAMALWNADTKSALQHAEQALEASKEASFPQGEARALASIGWIRYRMGQVDRAFEATQQALALAEKAHLDTLRTDLYINMGAIYNEQKQLEASMSYFQKAFDMAQRLQLSAVAARCLNNLGYTALKMEDAARAEAYTAEALTFIRPLGHDYYLAFALRNRGDWLQLAGKPREALVFWEESASISERIGNTSLLMSCLNRLGKASLAIGNAPKAISLLEKNASLPQAGGFRSELAATFRLLAEAYGQQGNAPQAYQWQSRYLSLHDSLFDEEQHKQLNALQAQFEAERQEQEILLLKAQKAEASLRYRQQRWLLAAALLLAGLAGLVATLIWGNRLRIQKAYRKVSEAHEHILQKNEEISRQAAALQEAQAQLLRSEKQAALGQLVAGVAHELNNPLNFVTGGMQALQPAVQDLAAWVRQALQEAAQHPETPLARSLAASAQSSDIEELEADALQLMADMSQGTSRIVAVVQALRVFSQLDQAGQPELVPLFPVLRRAAETLQRQFPQHALQLPPDEGRWVMGHPALLATALEQLLRNAFEASAEQPQPWVGISADPQGDRVAVCVSDNGPGIDPAHLPRIFDPFFTTKAVGQGLGMGLALADAIARQHAGNLSVENRPEGGCTACLLLPAGAA
jgi:signal transduction histidine kinase